MKDRYDVSNLPEEQFEPGSKGRVLKNLLGISGLRQMEQLESQLLAHVFGRV
jgi:cell filamentation protein